MIKNVPIKEADIPCRQCCNINATERAGKYVSNVCDLRDMKECPIWQDRDSMETIGMRHLKERRQDNGKD